MKIYLNAAKMFCNDMEKEGKITPISISLPSFELTELGFRIALLNYVTDRIKIGLLSGNYNNKKFSDEITYGSLFNTEYKIENGLIKDINLGHKSYLQKLLPLALKKDEYLEIREINRNAIKNACVTNMQHILLELTDEKNNSVPYEQDYRSSHIVKKDKFIATMLMLKYKMPHVYNTLNTTMNSYSDNELIKELREIELDPTYSVINQLFHTDKNLVLEYFPHTYKEISSLLKVSNTKFKY